MVMDFTAGDVLEQVDLNNMLAAINGNGVSSGLLVYAQTPVAMGITVHTGSCYIGNTEYTEGSTTDLTIEASHATLYRKDLITYDTSTSNPVVTKGTNHAGGDSDPIYPPSIPSGDILLAIIDVDPAVTTIVSADVHDKRIVIPGNVWEIVTSNNIELDSDWTEDTTTSTTYVKATNKEFTIPYGVCYEAIELYFTWRMKHDDTLGSSESRIYKDGVAVGAEKTRNTTSYTTFSDTLSGWEAGDKIQLYQKTSSGHTCYVDDFQIFGAYVKHW